MSNSREEEFEDDFSHCLSKNHISSTLNPINHQNETTLPHKLSQTPSDKTRVKRKGPATIIENKTSLKSTLKEAKLSFLNSSKDHLNPLDNNSITSPSILKIGNGLTITRVDSSNSNPSSSSLSSTPSQDSAPEEIYLEEISYKCDILLNHCRWCGCSTPRLHTYLTIKHKCDSFCTTVQNSRLSITTKWRSSRVQTNPQLPSFAMPFATKFHVQSKQDKPNLDSHDKLKDDEDRFLKNKQQSKRRKVQSKVDCVSCNSCVSSRRNPVPDIKPLTKKLECADTLFEQKHDNIKDKNMEEPLIKTEPPECPQEVTIKKKNTKDLTKKPIMSHNNDIYQENLRSIFGSSANLTVMSSNQTKQILKPDLKQRKRRGRPKKLTVRYCTKKRQKSTCDISENMTTAAENDLDQALETSNMLKDTDNMLCNSERIALEHMNHSNDSEFNLENLVPEDEYVVISDETLIFKGQNKKENLDHSNTLDQNSSMNLYTNKEHINFGQIKVETKDIDDEQSGLPSKKVPNNSLGNNTKTMDKSTLRDLRQKAKVIKRPRKSNSMAKRTRKRGRVTGSGRKSKPEESKSQRICVNSLPESQVLYINKSPSMKDIFGELSIKEEAPDSPANGDIPAEEFNEELLSLVCEEAPLHASSSQASRSNFRISSVKNFKTLLNEDDLILNDINNIVKHELEEKEEFPESPKPLQIDEDYEPPGTDEDGVSLESQDVPNVNPLDSISNDVTKCLKSRKQNVKIGPTYDVRPKEKKKKRKSKDKIGSISFITPLKLKISLNSGKKKDSNLGSTKVHSQALKVKKEPMLDWLSENCPPPAGTNPEELPKQRSGQPIEEQNGQEQMCKICDLTFDGFASLAEHLEEHQKEGFILCFYCQRSFGDKTSMKRHMRTHTGERPYQCKICLKRFSLPGNFKKHRDIHEDRRTEPCSICGKTFRRKEHLKYHMRTHTGEKPYKCTRCGASFTARYSLHIHMNIHLGRKPYKCSYCSKAFSDKSTMRKHIRVHTGEKPFTCLHCHKCFGESGTLAAHMATHMTERPFSCSQCRLTFKTNGGLRQHKKVHVGDKQYSCKFCGMRFLLKYNMTMHERIHTGEKPYKCSHCERCFRSRSCLGKHIILHGGEEDKRFKCEHCHKRFHRSAHLRRHEFMHAGIKPFKCDKCPKGFATKSTLRKHKVTFHADGARKFPCEVCGKVFKRFVYVRTHLCPGRPNDSAIKLEPVDKDSLIT